MTTPAVIVVTREELAGIVQKAVANALAEARQDAGPLLLDRTNAAKVLGIGISSVDRYRKAGMPCYWIGDTPRFAIEECMAWLREHRRNQPSEGE